MEVPVEVAEPGTILAVTVSEFNDFGCAYCGGIFGTTPISGGGTTQWSCADCGRTTLVVNDGLERSTMGFGSHGGESVYPKVSPHPRRGQPVDREQVARDRQARILDASTSRLSQWLRLGYGYGIEFTRPGNHSSKSEQLAILAARNEAEDVEVTWFGDNGSFHFLGLALRRPLPATLMYPISSIFGHYALSGHVNPTVAPPVEFLSAYHRKTQLDRFGTNAGDGFSAALVIRYLRELSKLDTDRIMDICFHHTRYGVRGDVDGNAIDNDALFEALGLAVNSHPYDPALTELPADFFDEIIIDLYERIVQGQSAVRVKLAEGTLLPPMPIPFEGLCVDLQETALQELVPEAMQERPFTNQYGRYVVSYLPVTLLHGDQASAQMRYQAQQQSATPVCSVYYLTRRLTRDFIFSTPNMLDAALTAFFLVKVVAPMMQEMRHQA